MVERCVLLVDNSIMDLAQALRELEHLRIAADYVDDLITIAVSNGDDPSDSRFIYANDACVKIFGYPRDEIIGQRVTLFDGPETDRSEFYAKFASAGTDSPVTTTLAGYKKDGTQIPIELTIAMTRLRGSGETLIIGVGRDISDRLKREREMDLLTRTDPLTGLPNRAALVERLDRALAHAKSMSAMTAVLHVDIDGFKDINEFFGRKRGDQLLVAVGKRLINSVRQHDLVARQSGDEFLIVMPDIEGPLVAAEIARRIQGDMMPPFFVDDDEIFVTVSIGIGMHPADGIDVDTLMSKANTALITAKVEGRQQFRFYAPDMHDLIVRRLELVRELRSAAGGEEFVAYFQPIVDLATEEIVGAEALVRWNHPTRGLLMPDTFINAAEDSGLLAVIGARMLRHACVAVKRWEKLGFADLQVGVNISGRQILTPGFAESVRSALSASGVNPGQLVLEMTESVMITDETSASGVLDPLRAAGIRIALDDFGTGYSSLSWLQRVPTDVVKIDRSFVEGLETKRFDRSMADIIITLGKRLGLSVVAEGIETSAQAKLLREHGCDFGQGYLFGRPVKASDFEGMLLAQRRRVAS
jgi:diguanylate cyclase (GGDEF)-like protein/PAS domain S-box-containing protein